VKSVLEGSVRRAGDRVRITAQLINAANGFHLWAERYDRTLADVFAVQEEIAKSIADALRVALTPAESESLVQNRPDNVRAYDLYLRGRQRYGSYTAEALREALELFQQAIAIDPDYALAWAGVADCHGQMLQYEIAKDPEETARLGFQAARRAIAINPKLAEAHKAEALVLRFTGDFAGSKAALLKALHANPRFVPALINLAVEAMGDADLAGAERFIRRGLEIDPQEPFATTWLAQVLKFTGREDEMMEVAHRLRQLSDDPFYVTATHALPAWVHLGHGNLAGAEQALRDGIADGASPETLRAIEAAIAARAGREKDAIRLLGGIEKGPRMGPTVLAIAASAALRLGKPDLAERLIDRKYIRGFVAWTVRLDPELHPLLDRERFAPRRAPVTLVWPLEAPMIDAARHALFKEVRIESGLPQASDLTPGR
jgi:tetratricopeptide (TPR) repeat protein